MMNLDSFPTSHYLYISNDITGLEEWILYIIFSKRNSNEMKVANNFKIKDDSYAFRVRNYTSLRKYSIHDILCIFMSRCLIRMTFGFESDLFNNIYVLSIDHDDFLNFALIFQIYNYLLLHSLCLVNQTLDSFVQVKLVWIFGKIIQLYYIRKFNRKRYKWFSKNLFIC